MSDVLNAAVEALTAKLADSDFQNSAKFTINGEGSVVADTDGVRISDEETDVTLTADADVFEDMMSGDLDPTSAFMTGRLTIDGNMGIAIQLAGELS